MNKSSLGLIFIFSGVFGACQPLESQYVSVQSSQEAARALKADQAAPGFSASVKGLEADSFNATHMLNMGLSLESLGRPDDAAKAYKAAQKYAQAPEEKFASFFNEAQLLGKAKRVDEALALYQQALTIQPDSKEAKTNIELLTQQQQGGGEGENKDQQQGGQQNQKQSGQGDSQGDQKQDQKDKESEGEQKEKKYAENPKYVPRQFSGKELGESEVKKILGELKNQEQRIRAEYNRRDSKERARGKDW